MRDRCKYAVIAAAQGLAFAVAINTVRWIALELLRHGQVRRSDLGVAIDMATLPRRWVREHDWPVATGLRIRQVVTSSAAANAGLKVGDWIVGIQGAPVSQPSELLTWLGGENAGRTLSM